MNLNFKDGKLETEEGGHTYQFLKGAIETQRYEVDWDEVKDFNSLSKVLKALDVKLFMSIEQGSDEQIPDKIKELISDGILKRT